MNIKANHFQLREGKKVNLKKWPTLARSAYQ